MSLPRTPSFQHIHLYLIDKLSSHIRPSQTAIRLELMNQLMLEQMKTRQ